MSSQPQPAPQTAPELTPKSPIENGPSVSIPQTDIAHMGTSQIAPDTSSAPSAPPPVPPAPSLQMPPLPDGISQNTIDAAIAQVEQTGTTDGLSPDVLAAACAQLEVRAKAQGVDLRQAEQNPSAGTAPGGTSPHHVETAVLDKKSVMDEFSTQREALKSAVSDQREAMQQPYKDALAKAGLGGGALGQDGSDAMVQERMAELAAAVQDLDPATIALVNAMGAMTANPSILNNVMWIEIVRAVRAMIAHETKKQVREQLSSSVV